MTRVPGPGRPPTHAELFDSLGFAVFSTDAEGRIGAWNNRAAELLGWEARETIGTPLRDLVASQDLDTPPAGSAWQGTLPLRCRDGSVLHAFVRCAPVADHGGPAGLAIAAVELDDPELAAAVRGHGEAAAGARGGRVLSPREREILAMLAGGLTGEQIAQRLVLSPETVRTHIRNAREKLGASTRVEAVTMALLAGEIEL